MPGNFRKYSIVKISIQYTRCIVPRSPGRKSTFQKTFSIRPILRRSVELPSQKICWRKRPPARFKRASGIFVYLQQQPDLPDRQGGRDDGGDLQIHRPAGSLRHRHHLLHLDRRLRAGICCAEGEKMWILGPGPPAPAKISNKILRFFLIPLAKREKIRYNRSA